MGDQDVPAPDVPAGFDTVKGARLLANMDAWLPWLDDWRPGWVLVAGVLGLFAGLGPAPRHPGLRPPRRRPRGPRPRQRVMTSGKPNASMSWLDDRRTTWLVTAGVVGLFVWTALLIVEFFVTGDVWKVWSDSDHPVPPERLPAILAAVHLAGDHEVLAVADGS